MKEAGELINQRDENARTYGLNLRPFEISQVFTVVRKNPNGDEYIDELELGKVIRLI